MNPDQQQPRERSIPITTQGGGITTTHFPLSSSTTHPGSSGNSPFSNSPGRGGSNLFNQLHQFRKNQHADEMFSDRSHFPSFGYPSMSSGSRNDFFSHGHRDEDESESESHQPKVVNIPIQVETPEGVVPLSRSNSHSPGSSSFQFRNNNHNYHSAPSHGGGPAPEKTGETFTPRQRPGPSPTPPPKPRFTPSYKPEPQGYSQQSYQPEAHQQHHRVHNIPVQVEKGFQSRENDSRQNVPDQRFSVDPNLGRDSPDSQQSGGGPHVINIPINNDKRQQSENESQQSTPQPQPAPNQSKPTGESQKGPVDPIDLIKGIKDEAFRLESEVNNFDGESQKQYRFLDEMLTRCMLKLDNIDSNGRDDVRSARKSTLAYVDRVIAQLERKFNKTDSNEGQEEVTQTVDSNVQQSSEINSSMDLESGEADSSTQHQESAHSEADTIDSCESEQTIKAENQMEVESTSDDHEANEKPESHNQPDDQDDNLDDDQEGGNDGEEESAIEEEDPLGVDGSSKDFFNCSNNQVSNENICRTTEAVITEEMDKEEPPEEPPIKINGSNERDDKVTLQMDTLGKHDQQQSTDFHR